MKTILIPLVFATAFSSAFAETDSARELRQLQDQRQKAVAAAVDPITRRYQTTLEQILRRATLANDLDTAVKIKTELESMKPAAGSASTIVATPSVPAASPTTLPERYLGTWMLKGGDRLYVRTLKPDGVLVTQDGTSEWKVENNKLMLKSGNAGWDSFDLPGRHDRLEGKEPAGGTIILIRPK